jgi:hypothetical protein
MLHLGLFLLPSTTVEAQARYRVESDQWLSSAPMAEIIISGQRALSAVENVLLPPRCWTEDDFFPKAGGMLYRLARTVLLDDILDHLAILCQHEVFGHGARFREYGSWNNQYHLSLVPPYGAGSGWAQSDVFTRTLSPEEHILITTAGDEANTIVSLKLRRNWLLRGKINYRETVFYSLAAQNITYYIIRTKLSGTTQGDIGEYLSQVNALHSAVGATLSLDDLLWSCAANLLDPFQYFAGITYFYSYLWNGDEEWALPSFEIAGLKYLPACHFGLSPFGPEFYFDHYFAATPMTCSFYLRAGLPTFGVSCGMGGEIEGLLLTDFLSLSAALDLWYQPAVSYGAGGTLQTSAGGFGLYLSIGLEVYFTEKAGVTGSLGYKTDGWLPGKPLNNGFLFSLGLSFRE